MKNKIIIFLISILLLFIFSIFYKSLKISNLYEPKNQIRNIPQFSTLTFFEKKEVDSKNIFNEDKFYLLNIWASWCIPCREEHPLLLSMSKNNKLSIIGLNYKDNLKNAKEFLNELGNPYKQILIDKNGTLSIEWGAFGVPETYLIYKNQIKKKFVGPLNIKSLKEIEKFVK
ncbi:DsbE family thiol:disulfide interchange protein [Candidatus Pelagibacter sp.]|nr:DsbE family thiol:disulfide interchange protein [Candidatus Pelagibacter sp.]